MRPRHLLLASLLLVACNAILDNPERHLVDGAGGEGQATFASCRLNSECSGEDVCIFQTCGPPCNGDEDCTEKDSRCLRTEDGTACVSARAATCDAGCPLGTTCSSVDGTCRNECSEAECLSGQTCEEGFCVESTEPSAGGAGGTGGTGGADNNSTDPSVCGNGLPEADEECDDGVEPGDGCSADCQVEEGWRCDTSSPSRCEPECGDGRLIGAEAEAGGCDDGNLDAEDGCDSSCRVEEGFFCSEEPSHCAQTCGDGELEAGERCDDGNFKSGDGCTACAVENGFTCDIKKFPSQCADVDECNSATPPCAATFECTNTLGSFECACPKGKEACDGKCVNTQTDANNCGICNTICTQNCSVGRCVQKVLSNQATSNFAISGGNIYWSLWNQTAGEGVVMRASVNGGDARQLASSPTCVPLGSIIVTSTDIFWSCRGGLDSFVRRSPIDGGTTARVTYWSNTEPFVLGGGNVYFPSGLVIKTSPANMNQGPTDVTAYTLSLQRLAIDPSHLYWTESDAASGTVMKFPLAGGTSSTLATSQANAYGIAVDSSTVYWTNRASSGTVMKVALAGGTAPTTLASAQNQPSFLVLNGGNLYWSNSGGGSVMKLPVAGGQPTVVGSGFTSPTALAVDSTSVYVLVNGSEIVKITPK